MGFKNQGKAEVFEHKDPRVQSLSYRAQTNSSF